MVFVDESGFRLQPVRRRTWAPKGQTPIQRAWDRHDRLSAVAAFTLAPRRRRLGSYYQLHRDNLRTEQVVAFLRAVRRQLRRKAVVVWDRWSVHRCAARWFRRHRPGWFDFEWLPAYAPELNPVEQGWNHAKYADLANFVPDDAEHLHLEVLLHLEGQRESPRLLRSFFRFAGLPL